MEKIKRPNFFNILVIILCRLILPSLIIFLLLITPNDLERQPVQSVIFDNWIRYIAVIFFCANYWYLPTLFDSNVQKWLWISKFILEDMLLLNIFYIFIALGYSLLIAWFTFFIFSYFLPSLESYKFIFAISNSFIFLISFALRYKAFMELSANQKL